MSLNTKIGHHEACIRVHRFNGASLEQLSEAIGCTTSGLSAFCKRYSIAYNKPEAKPEATKKPGRKADPSHYTANPRVQKMAEMFRQGVTMAAIGKQFKISRERVRQLVSKVGLDGASGGKSAQVAMRGPRVDPRERRDAAIRAKWGVAPDLYRELHASGVVRGFMQHRSNAASRAVKWSLTFAQWLAVWQTSGKLHLRGKGAGHYCMSRMSDSGGYELGNVHVQLCTESSREAVEKWRGKTKEFPGVFLLYPGREMAWFAKVGKKSVGYFRTAEEASDARQKFISESGPLPKKFGPSFGTGRGWIFIKSLKTRPYQVRMAGVYSYHATAEEAEAEYKRRAAELMAQRRAPTTTAQGA